MAFETNPGPANPELLFLFQEHRARYVFYSQHETVENQRLLNDTLEVRRGDQKFFEFYEEIKYNIHPQVMGLIRNAGFGGILDCGFHRVDHGLVTALVERWRPETHTFHLPFGEVSITLQDVQILWGLNVDGNVITGLEKMNFNTLSELCLNFLGFTPDKKLDTKGSMINITRLIKQIKDKPVSNESTDIEIAQHARLYIMVILGGTMFPERSGSRVSIYFLYSLIDLENAGSFSWGSACLAYLYRCLCRATKPGAKETAGPMSLLQFWAWERISAFRPRSAPTNYNIHTMAYAARWACPHSYTHVATHCLGAARYSLACMTDPYSFAWIPYAAVLTDLPQSCTNGMSTWFCDTFMVYWEIVEPHLPSRVMRQFGYNQPIPRNVLINNELFSTLHDMKKKGRVFNWEEAHQSYIQHWYSRHEHMIIGDPADNFNSSAEYMNWYWPRTVIHIVSPNAPQNPGFQDIAPSYRVMAEGLAFVRDQAANQRPGNELTQISQRYMDEANASHWLPINEMYYSQRDSSYPGAPPPQVQNARRSRNRPGRNMGGEPSTSYQPPGPSMQEFGGSSNQYQPQEDLPDLNVGFTPPLRQPPNTDYFTPPPPTPPPISLSGNDDYTPQPPLLNIGDMHAGPSRGAISPTYMEFDNTLSWTELINAMDSSTPSHDVSIPPEDDLRNWELVPNRERRPPRPRGPCHTSRRYTRHNSDH